MLNHCLDTVATGRSPRRMPPPRLRAVPRCGNTTYAQRHGPRCGDAQERRCHGCNPQAVPQQDQSPAGRGVWGGLAEYFNLDATLIRVLFVVLAVLGGSGVVLYIALWIIVPREP